MLIFGFCDGVYEIVCGSFIVCPVIVDNCANVNGVCEGVNEFV